MNNKTGTKGYAFLSRPNDPRPPCWKTSRTCYHTTRATPFASFSKSCVMSWVTTCITKSLTVNISHRRTGSELLSLVFVKKPDFAGTTSNFLPMAHVCLPFCTRRMEARQRRDLTPLAHKERLTPSTPWP